MHLQHTYVRTWINRRRVYKSWQCQQCFSEVPVARHITR